MLLSFFLKCCRVKMAGKSNRGKNRGTTLIDNSMVVADANGVQQSNLGDKPSGVDESTSAKSEVVDTIKQPQATNPNRWKVISLFLDVIFICIAVGCLAPEW